MAGTQTIKNNAGTGTERAGICSLLPVMHRKWLYVSAQHPTGSLTAVTEQHIFQVRTVFSYTYMITNTIEKNRNMKKQTLLMSTRNVCDHQRSMLRSKQIHTSLTLQEQDVRQKVAGVPVCFQNLILLSLYNSASVQSTLHKPLPLISPKKKFVITVLLGLFAVLSGQNIFFSSVLALALLFYLDKAFFFL